MIPFLDLAALHTELRPELDAAVARVLDSGHFVLGEEVERFEAEFAEYVGAPHCVSVGNGLDALHLALRGLGIGPGDEVLVPSHTFVATWLAVDLVGAVPIPVEPVPGRYGMDPEAARAAISSRTRAVLPVHLYGEPVDLDAYRALCQSAGLALVEDAAQAHGATYRGARIGSSGTAAWSFYPGKNLGALGDGGAVTTDDAALAAELRRLRNYGSERKYVHSSFGVNSRLDELQAAVLRVKLGHLDRHAARRQAVADRYLRELPPQLVAHARPDVHAVSAWHLFVVQTPERDALQLSLTDRGIATQVHYPVAVHQQGVFAARRLKDEDLPLATQYAAGVLSLPMSPHLRDEQVDTVLDAVNAWAAALTGSST